MDPAALPDGAGGGWTGTTFALAAVFSAEPGVTTQLVTPLSAADREVDEWLVFAGGGWVLIGVWTLLR